MECDGMRWFAIKHDDSRLIAIICDDCCNWIKLQNKKPIWNRLINATQKNSFFTTAYRNRNAENH